MSLPSETSTDANKRLEKLADYSRTFPCFCIYHSNASSGKSFFDTLGAFSGKLLSSFNPLERSNPPPRWHFGFLSYDLKNRFENLSSSGSDGIGLPEYFFFEPEVLVVEQEGKCQLISPETNETQRLRKLLGVDQVVSLSDSPELPRLQIRARFSREEYLKRAIKIRKHIDQGDVYELNFCQEFYATNPQIDPVSIYKKLNAITQAPFSAFCRFGDHYLISSSPERFLKKKGSLLFSQPIKGTRKRGATPEEDERLKKELLNDEKERAENVMIVDLVRNDLSRIAGKGSVKVEELLALYSFEQVHQLISTISCTLKSEVSFRDILQATFPMGSMTGAPKIRAMQLIEHYECAKRGLYSGAIGYIDPSGDFDLSVVIRSIQYNAATGYLNFMTGSAITAKSDPEAEYEECLIKAQGMLKALNAELIV
jgi:para-aminobenzoate synthetase component 1